MACVFALRHAAATPSIAKCPDGGPKSGAWQIALLGADRRRTLCANERLLRAQYKHRKHDHLIFYDSWVARDLAGLPFANTRPFVLHQYSLARLQKGLPFPVSCCCNGMTVLYGTIFQEGYQFS